MSAPAPTSPAAARPDATAAAARRDHGIAFAWGWAEATCFFIVPDVFTTRVALRSLRSGLTACLSALAGALLGGWMIYAAARFGGLGDMLARGFAVLPGISPHLVEAAGQSLAREGWTALFVGAGTGVPYKLFALHAGLQGTGLGTFLLVSAAARLVRFAIVTGLAHLIARPLRRRWPQRTLQWVHAGAWAAFYGWYFWAMSGR